jgi:hypothetical protein
MITMVKEVEYPVYGTAYGTGARRVSFGAIAAGASVGVAVLAGLCMLGAGLGIGAVPKDRSAIGFDAALGFGGGLWLMLSGFLSSWTGGWISGRLSEYGRFADSVIHGIASWGVAVMICGLFFLGACLRTIGWIETARALGDSGVFGFALLALSALGAGFGARSGTRLYKPVSASEPERRHPIEV